MFNELGEVMGGAIVVLYTLTVLNYFVKFIYRKYKEQLVKNEIVFKIFTKLKKIIVKNHKLFGVLTIIFLMLHFLMQFSRYGFNISGLIAAGVMILQIVLGIYGAVAKKIGIIWFTMHRVIAIVLFIAIVIHTS